MLTDNLFNCLSFPFIFVFQGKDDAPAIYEFEVTSSSFRVNGDGYLIVDDPNLDRDPPNPSTHKFQVIN